jgi:hypothetical protein
MTDELIVKNEGLNAAIEKQNEELLQVQKVNLALTKVNTDLQKQMVQIQGKAETYNTEIRTWEIGLKAPLQGQQEEYAKKRESARASFTGNVYQII